MVSFQCEGCGDVQTKKKLDSHRNHCHAPFTCIDCMTTFRGTEYKSHTSCMTEDQKYQGHLYREKPSKANKRKSVSILEPTDANALIRRQPYVEDLVHTEIPPEVPTPPSAVPSKVPDSVFDFLVEDEPQNTPRITFTDRKVDQEEMAIKKDAPSVFSRPTSRNDYRNDDERNNDHGYEANGFSYGTAPVNPRPLDMNGSSLTLDFMTPAAKGTKAKLERPGSTSHSRTNSGSEKKRKRGQADDHNDTAMLDAPETIVRSVVDTPGVVHSGLTGGLSRMVTADGAYPSPYNESPIDSPNPQNGPAAARQSKQREDPGSPLKRTRRSKDDSKDDNSGLGISIKGRAGKVLSMVGGALTPAAYTTENGTMVKTRRRASSSDHTNMSKDRSIDEKRERKKHKVTRHNGTSSANVRHERTSDPKRKVKEIEYTNTSSNNKNEYSNSDSDERPSGGHNSTSQMVVFGAEEQMRIRCDSFLSYVTKGSRSERGYSIHKALKRWHRDRENYGSSGKIDEEKELWRGLRLRRNERGEVVLFF